MKRNFISTNTLILVCILFGSACTEKTTQDNRPNIIVFMVDDLGWQDTSVPFWNQVTPFNERYSTPNMERLAADGMKFTQAYATPVCTPTRVSLLSGMNAARHRVTNWTGRRGELHAMEKNHEELIIPVWNVNGISPEPSPLAVHADAFPQLLRESGYFTIHVGKAHFGPQGTMAEDPKALGFEINIAGHAAGSPASYHGLANFGNDENGTPVKYSAVPDLEKYHGKDITLTEALTIEAELALDDARQTRKPFFLYMAYYSVHTPIERDGRYYQKYKDKGLVDVEARYASMIEGMDHSLGQLMDYLQRNGLAENTIILFMSDNGGLSAHTRAGGELHTHNQPLSSGKGSAHEGGIREPMIVKWPGVVEPGSSNDNYVIIEDFFPTLLEMAGVMHYQVVQKIDGRSFVPLLTDNTPGQTAERPLFWHYPNEWGPSGPGIGAFSAVRLGDWKLIYYHKNEDYELFNLEEDIGETTNLVEARPEMVKELAGMLTSYLKEVNAQLPLHKSTGVKVAYP